jgi:hypothetical protein
MLQEKLHRMLTENGLSGPGRGWPVMTGEPGPIPMSESPGPPAGLAARAWSPVASDTVSDCDRPCAPPGRSGNSESAGNLKTARQKHQKLDAQLELESAWLERRATFEAAGVH